jgi:hypothetical protein
MAICLLDMKAIHRKQGSQGDDDNSLGKKVVGMSSIIFLQWHLELPDSFLE